MRVKRSGGGHEPEHSRPGRATNGAGPTGEGDSLRELFAESKQTEPPEPRTEASHSCRPNSRPERSQSPQRLRDEAVEIPTDRIRRVTVSTEVLALVTAGTLGYLSVRTGSSPAAFYPGLLLGLSGTVFGFGEIVDLLTIVHTDDVRTPVASPGLLAGTIRAPDSGAGLQYRPGGPIHPREWIPHPDEYRALAPRWGDRSLRGDCRRRPLGLLASDGTGAVNGLRLGNRICMQFLERSGPETD